MQYSNEQRSSHKSQILLRTTLGTINVKFLNTKRLLRCGVVVFNYHLTAAECANERIWKISQN